MELYKKQLLNILNCSINQHKFRNSSQEVIEWERIIKESEKHEISALIYNSIDKEILREIDFKILNKWKASVLEYNITQMYFLNCAKEILLGLQQKGVQLIVLKGLILKNFYPRPEFRTMGDLDILIDMKYYVLVEEYLKSIGYVCEKEKNSIHAVFYSENRPDVEVHWKLIKEDYYIGDGKEFEKDIWKNAKHIDAYGFRFKSLSDEDFLIHICFHMAVHTKSSGFGLRQLYDLALFTRSKYDEIEWTRFEERITKYGLLTFTQGLYVLCYKIFKIKVSHFKLENTRLEEEHINLLLENIIYFGVHGKQKEDIDSNLEYQNINLYNKFIKIMQVIFQNRKELSPKYVYVKNHFYLLPVAWIHRIIIVVKKYGLRNIFKYTKQAIEIREKKNEIAHIFNL